MIDQLRTKATETQIPVVVGDMATARVPGAFTLAYLVYNTISNLLTQAEQVACFQNAALHLTPRGCFVIELWVPELRKLPPGQGGTVFSPNPGTSAWTPTTSCSNTSSHTTFTSTRVGKRRSFAAHTAMSGPQSLI